jgi:hypothetical protein
LFLLILAAACVAAGSPRAAADDPPPAYRVTYPPPVYPYPGWPAAPLVSVGPPATAFPYYPTDPAPGYVLYGYSPSSGPALYGSAPYSSSGYLSWSGEGEGVGVGVAEDCCYPFSADWPAGYTTGPGYYFWYRAR